MEKLYLALVDTPGFFATVIRKVIGIDYIHVVLSMDEELNEAYSVGRRNPFIPILAGFEKEDARKIEQAFPTAKYKIVSMECTKEQKENISRKLQECFAERFHYHYCVLGLPMLLCNIPFYQKNHYTCSSFVANILKENGIDHEGHCSKWGKLFRVAKIDRAASKLLTEAVCVIPKSAQVSSNRQCRNYLM